MVHHYCEGLDDYSAKSTTTAKKANDQVVNKGTEKKLMFSSASDLQKLWFERFYTEKIEPAIENSMQNLELSCRIPIDGSVGELAVHFCCTRLQGINCTLDRSVEHGEKSCFLCLSWSHVEKTPSSRD